ncbi:MAG: DUF4412 domain-containing protein [Candidatus Cloacimonetes bacterium]|nr:DUF4412 domain-containing protein [Candidatus Cloacimonadota bacterium]
MKRKGLFLAFITLLLTSQAFAGWVMEEVSSYGESEKTTDIRYIQQNKMKSVGSETFIVDLEKGIFYFIVPEREAYWSGTPEEFRKLMEEGQKMMKEQQLESMTPEQREAYKQYMKTREEETKTVPPKQKVEVKKTSEKAKIAGYSGQKYEVWVDGKLKEDVWVCADIKPQDEIDIKKLVQFFETMYKSDEDEGSYKSSPEYKKIAIYGEKGANLKSITYDEYGMEKSVSETVKIEKKNIPDSEFEVPKNYKKLNDEEFIKGMMGQ